MLFFVIKFAHIKSEVNKRGDGKKATLFPVCLLFSHRRSVSCARLLRFGPSAPRTIVKDRVEWNYF